MNFASISLSWGTNSFDFPFRLRRAAAVSDSTMTKRRVSGAAREVRVRFDEPALLERAQ